MPHDYFYTREEESELQEVVGRVTSHHFSKELHTENVTRTPDTPKGSNSPSFSDYEHIMGRKTLGRYFRSQELKDTLPTALALAETLYIGLQLGWSYKIQSQSRKFLKISEKLTKIYYGESVSDVQRWTQNNDAERKAGEPNEKILSITFSIIPRYCLTRNMRHVYVVSKFEAVNKSIDGIKMRRPMHSVGLFEHPAFRETQPSLPVPEFMLYWSQWKDGVLARKSIEAFLSWYYIT